MLGAGPITGQDDGQAEQQEAARVEQQQEARFGHPGETQGGQWRFAQIKQQRGRRVEQQNEGLREQLKETQRVQAFRGPCSCPPRKGKRKNHTCCTVVFRRGAARRKPSGEGAMQALVTRGSCRCPGGVPLWNKTSQEGNRRRCCRCCVVVFHPAAV